MQPQEIIGKTVYASDGDKIGKTGQVFLDDQTGEPEWLTVNTGMFGAKETFIPIRDASPHGDDVTVPFSKDTVKGAPNVDADGGHLSESEEAELYRYYGRETEYATPAVGGQNTTVRDSTTQTVTTGTRGAGHDTSGPNTDDAMTRSEEQLRVGTERVESGRARLRKWITTEQVSTTVPITEEHAVVTREPITDANRAKSLDGPDITEAVHEVTLHRDQPVVAKETVPVERVRVGTETETVQQTVTGEVRKENIELIDPEDNTQR